MTEDYRVPVPGLIEDALQGIAKVIGSVLPEGWGFTLLIFTFEGSKDPQTMTYISNARRADMLKAMQEFLQKQGE